MHLYTHEPDSDLREFVHTIFHLKDYRAEHQVERIVPDTLSSLVVELDGQPRWIIDNDSFKEQQLCRNSWLSGPHTDYLSIKVPNITELFAIQFTAGGLFPFLNTSVSDFVNRVVPGEDALGLAATELRTQVLHASTSEEKSQLAATWLKQRLHGGSSVPESVSTVINRIREDPTFDTLTRSIHESKHSQKHLIALFKKHVGLRPGEFQRILRFNQALTRMSNHEQVSWAELSLDCGYSDQSHFARDFKKFSGLTPSGYERLETERENFFPLDENGDCTNTRQM